MVPCKQYPLGNKPVKIVVIIDKFKLKITISPCVLTNPVNYNTIQVNKQKQLIKT